MEVKKIVEGMTAVEVAEVIDSNFKNQNKILEEDIAKQNNVIGVSEYEDFSEAEAVAVGDVRKYEGFLYECVEATTGAFDASKWKKSSFKAETEKKLSELGSKLGIVQKENLIDFPARPNGEFKNSEYYKGYEINVKDSINNGYKGIFFKASKYDLKNVISSAIFLDNDNNVIKIVDEAGIGVDWIYSDFPENAEIIRITYCYNNEGQDKGVESPWEPTNVCYINGYLAKQLDFVKSFLIGNEIIYTFNFDKPYTFKKLDTTILKGEQVLIDGDFETISGRTNWDDEDYQIISNGDFADRDINYIKNIDEIGSIEIKVIRIPITELSNEINKIEQNFIHREVVNNLNFGIAYKDYPLDNTIYAGERIFINSDKEFTGRTIESGEEKQTIYNGCIAAIDINFIRSLEIAENVEFKVIRNGLVKSISDLSFANSFGTDKIFKIQYPARTTGADTTSGFYYGYEVNLSKLYDKGLRGVCFQGASYLSTGNIVPGVIYDTDGNVESFIELNQVSDYINDWFVLPLTEKSLKLRCSVGKNEDYINTIFKPSAVFFIPKNIYDLLKVEAYSDDIRISLPETIYAIKDRTLQLFWRGCINAVNPYNYDILVNCAIGNKYQRYYEVTPNSVGSYPITVSVRDNNKNILGSKSCNLVVSENNLVVSEKLNVLCVGASATATGYWASELQRMLTESGGDPEGFNIPNIAFVGRKLGTYKKDVLLEATGGWSWNTFISAGVKAVRFTVEGATGLNIGDTYIGSDGDSNIYFSVEEINVTEGVGNIRCTYRYDSPSNKDPEAVGTLTKLNGGGVSSISYSSIEIETYSPFYNNGELDFITYANDYCEGHIDVLITHMGVNSALYENANIPSIINQAKQFIDGFLADFPNGKMIISAIPVPSQDGGLGVLYNTSGNINQYGTLLKFNEYNDALAELCKSYSDKVYFAPVNAEFDSDYGFPSAEKSVNSRQTQIMEKRGTNPTHPLPEGSYMVADSILRTFINSPLSR